DMAPGGLSSRKRTAQPPPHPPARTALARPALISPEPRATARSPATSTSFSVSMGPRMPTAIDTCAAIAFMTVFGKVSGDRPRTPRWRNPSANASGDRKSPQCEPRTSPSPDTWSGWRLASVTASRAATTASWLARASRRASLSGRAAVRSPTSAPRRLEHPSVGNPWTGPIAERPRERASATSAPGPAPSALTLPIPVTTIRGRAPRRRSAVGIETPRRGGAPEQEAQVLAAEPERVRQGVLDRRPARDVRHAVERSLGIRLGEIGRGRDELVDQRQHGRDGLERPGRRHRVANERL